MYFSLQEENQLIGSNGYVDSSPYFICIFKRFQLGLLD